MDEASIVDITQFGTCTEDVRNHAPQNDTKKLSVNGNFTTLQIC